MICEHVVGEHLERLRLGQHDALEFLLVLDDLLAGLLDDSQVALGHGVAAHVRVVVEASLHRGANSKVSALQGLETLAQDVGARVPEDHAAFLVVELEQLQLTVPDKGAENVPELGRLGHGAAARVPGLVASFVAVHVGGRHAERVFRVATVRDAGHDDLVGQALRDLEGHVQRRGLPSQAFLHGAVGQRDLDGRLLGRQRLQLLLLLGHDAVVHGHAGRHEGRVGRQGEGAADLGLAGRARDLGAALLGEARLHAGGFGAHGSLTVGFFWGELGQSQSDAPLAGRGSRRVP